MCSASNSHAQMEDSRVSWLDLPDELWPLIGQCLETYIDTLRFRSVCRLWRDSFPKVKPSFPPSLPHNSNPQFLNGTCVRALIFQRIIYRFIPIHPHPSSNSKGFLAMIDRGNSNLKYYCPFTWFNKSTSGRKEVNFMDYRIHEVARSYLLGTIHFCTTSSQTTEKFLVFPGSFACIGLVTIMDEKLILLLNPDGRLWFLECGENIERQEWKLFGEGSILYDDAISYHGQIYMIDRHGRVYSIDSSMRLVRITFDPMCAWSDLKHLVECEGELYVVSRFVEGPFDIPHRDEISIRRRRWCDRVSIRKSIDFKVHRLDRGGGRLVDVKNLGNHAFVLGSNYCFSISNPGDVEGFERNCIYFLHDMNMFMGDGHHTHVFDLEKGTIMKSSAKILRAPPARMELDV